MRRFLSFMVVFMISVVCMALEPQKIVVSELLMNFRTKTEQIHTFYGAGNFIVNKSAIDCTPMKTPHSISIRGDKLTIDSGTEDETIFKIATCTYNKGKVFADRGTMELYRLSCNELSDNELSPWTSIITIQEVKDGARSKTIITIPSYDSDGVMFQSITLQD
jgi:hypothetical protein